LASDNIPSVIVNESGICNYCAGAHQTKGSSVTGDEEFIELLEKFKDRKYQVLMAYSGGKDSTFTLKFLKEKYNASILAVTFNNGFLSSSSIRNINHVTDYLDVDSIIMKYPSKELIRAFKLVEDGGVFPKIALERASAICNLCITLIKNMVYYEAILRSIPIICFGWTPGQTESAKPILRLDCRMVSKAFNHIKSAVVDRLGNKYAKYFLDTGFMEKNAQNFPYLYYPFVKNNYNEAEIIEEIQKIGWEYPENTDGNSSNCLLNSYATQRHIDRFGYHPYNYEISNMIRRGYMSREAGAKKLADVKNDAEYEIIKSMFESV
jgi:tRNA(Ile)-lysidine synthase TilS/MesJ